MDMPGGDHGASARTDHEPAPFGQVDPVVVLSGKPLAGKAGLRFDEAHRTQATPCAPPPRAI
jgi:hypothetical protein